MVIAHNLVAMNAQRQYGIVTSSKAKNTEKLSSGYKINRAADDAAGLTISEKMRSQIRGLNQGIENSQHGISMTQIGDGALAEVHEMLNRLTELSVKAANGTLTAEDREAVNKEVNEIKAEIDRIGESVEFNTIPLFRGTDEVILGPDGKPSSIGNVPVDGFTLSSIDLGQEPISEGSNANALNLVAIAKPDSSAPGAQVRLIYGGGSTSQPMYRLQLQDDSYVNVNLHSSNVSISDYSHSGNTWTRTIGYKDADKNIDVAIHQTIKTNESSSDKKYYSISYEFENNGEDLKNVLFSFNADTAYGGDHQGDVGERYFMDGNEVSKSVTYSTNDSPLTPFGGSFDKVDYTGIPNSFSIVNPSAAYKFTENINFDTTDVVNFTVGNYSETWNMDTYYDSSNLNSNLGRNIIGHDLEFSIVYNLGEMANGAKKAETLNYGIADLKKDPNLKPDIPIIPDDKPAVLHDEVKNVWIQAGPSRDNGLWLHFKEMNSTIIGI